MKHFGFYTDPGYSIQKNTSRLICTTHPLNFPRKSRNLRVCNLCTDPTALSKEILETIGLSLAKYHFIYEIEQPNRLQSTAMLHQTKVSSISSQWSKQNFIPTLKVPLVWEPPVEPKNIKMVIDGCKNTTNEALQVCWKKNPIIDMKKNHQYTETI